MKKKYCITIVVVVTIGSILFLNRSVILGDGKSLPKDEPNLRLETKDSNNDGKIDNWIYRDKKGIPVKWIQDTNHDGRPNEWSFFNNGRAFLDEADTNQDGKVDQIYINLFDSQSTKQRVIDLILRDKEANTFDVQFDTGWITDNNFKNVK